MDMIIQTSLEALLLKATSSQNLNIDTAAVEAFCTLVNKEKDGAQIGAKVIANRLHAGVEKEVLQTLNILDCCMDRCGSHFQAEIGKFRFLNEMIKLVSPKYLGGQTPMTVKQKVIQSMYSWTSDYPKETKIKEAYDMLRKQGVIRENPNIPNASSITSESNGMPKRKVYNSIFQDEEKSKILQKLLQSKDPEDIQAANWLIKSMVKEDDKRAELKSRRVSELESIQNNVRLLNEMLDSYKLGNSSKDDVDLIKELHQSCERLRPNVMKLASETPQNEELLGDVLQINDELTQVFSKFTKFIINNDSINIRAKENDNSLSLLSFEGIACGNENKLENDSNFESKTNLEVLSDIFSAVNDPDLAEVLKPVNVKRISTDFDEEVDSKIKAMKDLDVLGEDLLKENLQEASQRQFNRQQDKIPMNLMFKQGTSKPNFTESPKDTVSDPLNFDITYLLTKYDSKNEKQTENSRVDNVNDDCLVDLADEKLLEDGNSSEQTPPEVKSEKPNLKVGSEIGTKNAKTNVKLGDIFVELEKIKPSSTPPLTILEEKNGISITLHFAKDKPREGVHVFVVTSVSKSEMPLENFLFQAVAPKGCKLKLQPPSRTDLPAFNPFLPPSAITQIMLIANPDDLQISFKFVVSYLMDDETVTEMGEVPSFPVV